MRNWYTYTFFLDNIQTIEKTDCQGLAISHEMVQGIPCRDLEVNNLLSVGILEYILSEEDIRDMAICFMGRASGNRSMEKNMDNILVEKIWEDEGIIELKITGISEFVTAYQTCYTQEEAIKSICRKLSCYANDFTNDCYIQIGSKEGNHTPSFSMNILKADSYGHVKIEVDIEIADISDRSHRCIYYINSELGAIERLGARLNALCNSDVGEEICMF